MTNTQLSAYIQLAGCVGGVLFFLFYTVLSGGAWLKNEHGRNVVFFTLSITVLMVNSVVYYYIYYPKPPPEAMIQIDLGVTAVIVLLLYQRLWQMIRAQIYDRSEDKEK